jgi:hypothetical protein
MSARLYRPEDAAGLDELLSAPPPHLVDLTRDKICVVGDPVSGVLVGRPAMWVHELRLAPGNLRVNRAHELFERAFHWARGAGYRDVLFFVDAENRPMLRTLPMLRYKPCEQPPARIFRVALPPLPILGGNDGVGSSRTE